MNRLRLLTIQIVSVCLALFAGVSGDAAPISGASLFGGSAQPSNLQSARTGQPQNIHPAVCRIVAPGTGSVSFGSGTLVAVNDKYGLVITNWHVVNELAGQLWVMFPDGFQSPGALQKTDRDWDLAAIAIFRPNAEPVKVASAAPRPGELLTIAGYGSGDYRAVSGRCTQYVAPGMRFPYEMVELAATARQGDSGGPILNDRGELAGVLFGAGGGRTSGSYSGRVEWFLSSLQRPAGSVGTPVAALAKASPQSGGEPLVQNTASPSQSTGPLAMSTTKPQLPDSSPAIDSPPSITDQPVRIAALSASTTAAARASNGDNQTGGAAPPVSLGSTTMRGQHSDNKFVAVSPIMSPRSNDSSKAPQASSPSQGDIQHLTLAQILGPTPGDQLKTILAGVGLLAVLVKTLGWLTTPPPKKKKAARA